MMPQTKTDFFGRWSSGLLCLSIPLLKRKMFTILFIKKTDEWWKKAKIISKRYFRVLNGMLTIWAKADTLFCKHTKLMWK